MNGYRCLVTTIARLAMLAALAGPATAAETTPQSPAATSLQDQFNAASETADSGSCDKAIPLFEALTVDPRVKPGSLPAAAIAVRHGRCLILTGKEAAGEALVRSGLSKLDAAGPGFADEVATVSYLLGQLAWRRFDHDSAVEAFTRAAASSDRPSRLQAMIRLAQVKLFDGDGEAVTLIDKAMADVGDKLPADKEARATLISVRSRALMNLGRDKEAADDLRRALDLSGGLTLKVSLNDLALRGDLAQAMLLLGKRDEARKYLAYTGAGRIEQSPFNLANYMSVPRCTGEPGLRPEDSAVVEFSIGKDGQVAAAQTVYTRGSFAAAKAFAEEVQDWAWSPDKIAKLPAIYRSLIRVELHCTTAGSGIGGVTTPLFNRLGRWAGPLAWKGLAPDLGLALDGTDAGKAATKEINIARKQALELLRTAGAKYEATDQAMAAAAAFTMAGLNERSARALAIADLTRASALITKADPRSTDPATAPVLAALRVFLLIEQANSAADARKSFSQRGQRAVVEAGLTPGLTDPLIAADPLAIDTLKLSIASLRRGGTPTPEQAGLIRAVADDSRLEDGHPLRQIALLRLANAAASAKQYQEAQALFDRTGLTEQQCALIGDIPRRKSDGTTGNDYPMEAQEMGFEGWVRLEYDIDATGRTANQRALIAYPPFVFVDAAKDIARSVRYDLTYRPSGKLACSATSETVRFSNP